MALLRAFGALLHKGIIGPALDEIGRAQGWLHDLPVSEYTDIQVGVQNHKDFGFTAYL